MKNYMKTKTIKHIISIGCLLIFSILLVGSGDSENSSESSEVVSNSSWDASVSQVKDYLDKNLRDPNSTEYDEWSKVVKKDDGTFMVRCKYRSKNGFGGMVNANQVFYLDAKGNITSVTDYYGQ